MAIDIYNPTGGTSMIPYNTTTPPYSTPGQPSNYNDAYGGIPNLPAYLTDTTSTTGADPWAQIEAKAPGSLANTQTQQSLIASNMAGQIDPLTLAKFQQTSAEQAQAHGLGTNAPATSASYLKALDLGMLALQNQGQTQQNQFLSSFPIQQQQTTTQNTDLGALRAMYAAAPVPAAAASANMNATRQGMNAGQGAGQVPLWQQMMNQLEQESQHTNDWFYQPVAGAGKAWSGVGVAPGAAGSPLPLNAGDPGYGQGESTSWGQSQTPFYNGFGMNSTINQGNYSPTSPTVIESGDPNWSSYFDDSPSYDSGGYGFGDFYDMGGDY